MLLKYENLLIIKLKLGCLYDYDKQHIAISCILVAKIIFFTNSSSNLSNAWNIRFQEVTNLYYKTFSNCCEEILSMLLNKNEEVKQYQCMGKNFKNKEKYKILITKCQDNIVDLDNENMKIASYNSNSSLQTASNFENKKNSQKKFKFKINKNGNLAEIQNLDKTFELVHDLKNSKRFQKYSKKTEIYDSNLLNVPKCKPLIYKDKFNNKILDIPLI